MNRSIRRVFWGVVVLFALLLAYTARWSIVEADDLRQNSLNKIPLLREMREPRGPILTRGGETIARSVRRGRGEDAIYERRYPRGSLFGHPVGYSYSSRGSVSLERFYDDELVGRREEFVSVLDSLLGRQREAKTMLTALDEQAQRVAGQSLAGRAGAVVVIEPRTGKIPVYVSVPGYDANDVRTEQGFAALNDDSGEPQLVDRVSQAAYPPGSTFKVVTATAGLDSGAFQPDSVLNGKSPQDFSGTPLANSGDRSFGDISLTTALTNSVNTVWAQVGEQVGADTMIEYMKRFGFYDKPPIDLPARQVVASGLRSGGDLLPDDTSIDVGRVAIGQERLAVTPLQMATVAATVANGGVRVAPHIADEFRDRVGRRTDEIKTDRVERVMKATTAKQLNEMMQNVVKEGTGTAAALAGINVAGKTGTAETRGGAANQAWFIGFAPAVRPRYAIAVTIQETTEQGGTVAAPIARDVLQSLLR
ncbi:MAG: penicillin-binding transpeptidase domain-containing protein [Solirubrobacterales bacterium]